MPWSTNEATPPLFLGVDPGKSGSMVLLDKKGLWVDSIKHTETERELWRWLRGLRKVVAFGYIERVHSMPKQGVASSFKFGESFGMLHGLVTAARVKWQYVNPAEWQTALRCRSGGDKSVTKAAAERLWPDVRVTHTVADAALIAEYCRREWLAREERT